MTPFKRALALPAALAAVGGFLAVSLPAASSEASTTSTPTLCKQQTARVDSSAYTVENNEWGSSEPECITPDGSTGFTMSNSSIANSTYGAPGGYAAIYKGCHWGACTPRSGFPIQVSDISPGKVTTSWSTAQPGGSNAYDVAYDIWFNKSATTTGQPNGTELMIWLNHNGHVQPFGAKAASNVSIGGRGYDVWYGNQGWNTVSYTMTTGTTSISNFDLRPVIEDAVSRGWISPSWYLIDVEAGFEVWQGGHGLATKSFSVDVNGHPAAVHSPTTSSATPSSSASPSSSSPMSSPMSPEMSPASPSSSATPSSSPSASSSATPSSSESPLAPSATPSSSASPLAPSASPSSSASPLSPSSPASISLQGISPNPSAPGTPTNVTVDFTNNGMTAASNVTLVTKIRNSAGTAVSQQAETGQNLATGQTDNISDAWTPSSDGTYTIEGVVQDSSSGKTLEHANVGTVTVKG